MFYLILPNIRSCHNVGAMFRTADAFAVDKIYLVGYTPQPPRKDIDKVALGAETWIPWEHRKFLKPTLNELKDGGFKLIALEKNKTSLDVAKIGQLSGNVALIVGNEVTGVRREILKMCDLVTHIPMLGKKESLNVSVAAGIAMHALRTKII
jgi:tRNA G18 (ribose-2'-O)-methylase SpoU